MAGPGIAELCSCVACDSQRVMPLCLLTHSLTHSLTHALTHSLTHSPTCRLQGLPCILDLLHAALLRTLVDKWRERHCTPLHFPSLLREAGDKLHTALEVTLTPHDPNPNPSLAQHTALDGHTL